MNKVIIDKYDVFTFKHLCENCTLNNLLYLSNKMYATKEIDGNKFNGYVYFFINRKNELIAITNMDKHIYDAIETIKVDTVQLVNIPAALLEFVIMMGTIHYSTDTLNLKCFNGAVIQPLLTAQWDMSNLDRVKWKDIFDIVNFYKVNTFATSIKEYLSTNPQRVTPVVLGLELVYIPFVNITLNEVHSKAKEIINMPKELTVSEAIKFFRNQIKYAEIDEHTRYAIYNNYVIGFVGDILMSIRELDLNCGSELYNKLDKVYYIENYKFSNKVEKFIQTRIFLNKLDI